MILFPILNEIAISDYGLYPGQNDEGLSISFKSMTLVLGANGLGKTTLITILYRLLSGAWDISAFSTKQEILGTASLDPTTISAKLRNMFADRVADNAKDSVARLNFSLGDRQLVIKRNLHRLKLISFEAIGEDWCITKEDEYQSKIAELAGVESFSDWLLLLRYIVFYFEDRRALLWDPTAQRQLLRALFLNATATKQWREEEREILQLDSRMRNLRSAYRKEKASLDAEKRKIIDDEGLQDELSVLHELQKQDLERIEDLKVEICELDELRIDSRRKLLTSQSEYESAKREYEHAKLLTLQGQFPSQNETALYILSQLLTNEKCLICGSKHTKECEIYEERIRDSKCIICGSKNNTKIENIYQGLPVKRFDKVSEKLLECEQYVKNTNDDYQEILQNFEALSSESMALKTNTQERGRHIQAIEAKLPTVDTDEKKNELDVLSELVHRMENELATKRKNFSQKMEPWNIQISKVADQVKEAFGHYAKDFLFEECSINWDPQATHLGQGGETIQFPGFSLDMSGADFPNSVRRRNPEHVSESQREFIDLSFRMAIMETVSSGGSSLVIDAPESSLDAVFVRRAAATLNRFAYSQESNRLVVASNLIDGDLIPSLLSDRKSTQRESTVISLFDIALPTAAVREYREEYNERMTKLLQPQELED